MIKGEERLPMSLMERISDEPCEPNAYLDYAIDDMAQLIAYWKTLAPDGQWWNPDADKTATVANVVAALQRGLFLLEELKLKYQRWPERVQRAKATEEHEGSKPEGASSAKL